MKAALVSIISLHFQHALKFLVKFSHFWSLVLVLCSVQLYVIVSGRCSRQQVLTLTVHSLSSSVIHVPCFFNQINISRVSLIQHSLQGAEISLIHYTLTSVSTHTVPYHTALFSGFELKFFLHNIMLHILRTKIQDIMHIHRQK